LLSPDLLGGFRNEKYVAIGTAGTGGVVFDLWRQHGSSGADSMGRAWVSGSGLKLHSVSLRSSFSDFDSDIDPEVLDQLRTSMRLMTF
jgi:hypothetical protein